VTKPEPTTVATASAPAVTVAAPTVTAPPEVPAPPAVPRLPVVDVELPPAPDAATERAWQTAADGLVANDFKAADKALADLGGKRSDPPTRETARLARALWWIANGKEADVQPVIADLAANATTSTVRKRARELLRSH